MSTNLRSRRRQAAKALKVGKNRVWFDSASSITIAASNSASSIKRLIKDGTIARRSIQTHSRYRANKRAEEKKLGRHSGLGKRKGAKNARCNKKTVYIEHIRALRKITKKSFIQKKISSSQKRQLFLRIKGNEFKSSKNLVEAIIQIKNKMREEKENK
ncbi:MAG: 60S ribosomal protein L19 [Paramarteilia canceri]